MKLRRTSSLAALAALALSGVLVTPSPSATGATRQVVARATVGTLSVSPTRFVSGQSLLWTGRLPVAGVRTITMQRFLNRPGDSWIDVKDFRGQTNPDGSFSFRYPAPDMQNIGFRVKSGTYHTAKLDMYPKMQDVVLTTPDSVTAGQPFSITANTILTGAPTFEGRVLTLQQRVDPTTWTTLQTTTVGSTGQGTFSGVVASDPGTAVYRVREEDWTPNGNQVGWYPSFPTYVDVQSASGRSAGTATAAQSRLATTNSSLLPVRTVGTYTSSRTTSALRFNWGYPIFDFDWTSGESLTSPPWRGSRLRGQWTEYSDGTGRIAKRSGQLGVWSGRTDRFGSGNVGTTATTLQGNAQSYGRWEMKMRTVTRGTGSRYLVRAELVPENAADYDCGAHNITIAEIRGGRSQGTIAATDGADRWTRAVDFGNLDNNTPAVGVELMQDHVTWFVNSSPVATLRQPTITGGVPMTLRLSLVGDGPTEMANTVLLSDWQRGFPLNRSPGVLSGSSLTRSPWAPSC